jgi:hypothetical protein
MEPDDFTELKDTARNYCVVSRIETEGIKAHMRYLTNLISLDFWKKFKLLQKKIIPVVNAYQK